MAQNPKRFDCDTCSQNNCTEKPVPAWPLSIGPAEYDRWSIPEIIDSRVCLKPMVRSWCAQMLNLYSHYKNGVLPFSGGLLEQPNPYLISMGVIDSKVNE